MRASRSYSLAFRRRRRSSVRGPRESRICQGNVQRICRPNVFIRRELDCCQSAFAAPPRDPDCIGGDQKAFTGPIRRSIVVPKCDGEGGDRHERPGHE